MDGQFSLGVMYAQGRGVSENDFEAVRWYRKAAEQGDAGDAGAQANLGSMYAMGDGVPKDMLMAYVWWSLAKAKEESSAIKNIGIVESRLTAEEIAEGQALAARCYESGYVDCD